MKPQILTLSIITMIGFALTTNTIAADQPEASQKVRNAAAVKTLSAEPQAALLYVKGLCCASCGIGVRKKISKLDFVNKKRFNKGVDLDPKTQLVTIALKPGESAAAPALVKAVDAAGYEAVHIYTLEGGKLKTKKLPKSSK